MDYFYPIGKKRAAIKVERINGKAYKFKVVPNSICIIKEDTVVKERPEAKIYDEDGNEVLPTGKFLWSAETIDPFHLVTDYFD